MDVERVVGAYMTEPSVIAESRSQGMGPDSPLKVWIVAARAFALPASVMPVAFGAVLAVTIGEAPFDFGLFVASLVAMAVLHTGANLLNDVYDYRKGIDRQVNPVSGAVVRRWITPKQALTAATACLALGCTLGLYIASQVGAVVLYIGVVGVVVGIVYSWGPWPLKYHALGDLAVFLDFGILGALGAWTVQTGQPSWVPAVWAIPMSLLVVGILHSNNWRDIDSDTHSGIRTVASCLGDARSAFYHEALLYAPFAIIVLLVLLTHVVGISPKMPVTFLITLLALPLAIRLTRTGAQRRDPQNHQAFAAMDGAVARLNLVFGLLCLAALGLHVWVR